MNSDPFCESLIKSNGGTAPLDPPNSTRYPRGRNTFANVTEVKTPKGVHAYFAEDHVSQVISFSFTFEGGTALDPVDKQGLSQLGSSLFNEGAGDYTVAGDKILGMPVAMDLKIDETKQPKWIDFSAVQDGKTIVNQGIFYTGFDANWASLIIGVLLLVAVLMNNTFRNMALTYAPRTKTKARS